MPEQVRRLTSQRSWTHSHDIVSRMSATMGCMSAVEEGDASRGLAVESGKRIAHTALRTPSTCVVLLGLLVRLSTGSGPRPGDGVGLALLTVLTLAWKSDTVDFPTTRVSAQPGVDLRVGVLADSSVDVDLLVSEPKLAEGELRGGDFLLPEAHEVSADVDPVVLVTQEGRDGTHTRPADPQQFRLVLRCRDVGSFQLELTGNEIGKRLFAR